MTRAARSSAALATAILALALPEPLAARESPRGLTAGILAGASHPTPAFPPDPAEATVLLGGINESWLSLAAWVPMHAAAGRQVFGCAYDQRVDDLETSARRLAVALARLNKGGVRRLHVVAYSMGGWVAKAALDRMTADGSIATFDSIDLTALATPWGGFERANIAWRLRALPTRGIARAISRAIGKPMAFEVGSRTPFVRARRSPLPPHVTFHVFESAEDEIAAPRTAEERENYEAVVALATERVTIPGARHADMRGPVFVSAPSAAFRLPSSPAETPATGESVDFVDLELLMSLREGFR
jgi:hypothetical protein